MRVDIAPLKYPTIVHAASHHAKTRPNEPAFELVLGEDNRQQITYAELEQQALIIADYLKANCSKGDRILLPTNNELSFHISFLGCLYAGCIGVPIQIPRPKPNLPDMGLGRFMAIIKDCQPTAALIDDIYLELLNKFGSGVSLVFGSTDIQSIQNIINNHEVSGNAIDFPEKDDLAFLQYTSGSTSNPKGVMLTHQCIAENQRSISHCYQLKDDTTIISWLPIYHDMGLASGFFMPLYTGFISIIIQPLAFIAKPHSWLVEISRHKNVATGGPNFAYSHCTDRIPDKELAALDLSEWYLAFCGAEPIRKETLDNFDEKFAEHGFNRDVFCPSYGLAEATLYVSAKNRNEAPVISTFSADSIGRHQAEKVESNYDGKIMSLFSCGRPNEGEVDVRIVDPETLDVLADGEIGEIAAHSDSIGIGYWNNPEATEQAFGCKLNGIEGKSYLLTGDYGFLYEGELYISGRKKEVIIINGVNHYPQDVEHTAQQQDVAFANYKAAAFAVQADQNHLVLLLEAKQDALPKDVDATLHKIKQAVRLEHQLIIDDAIIVPPGQIPKTSSGKVQRTLCAKLYQKGHFSNDQAIKTAS